MTLQQKLLAKKSKKGFTLVELVVVIAILGILAAIAIPAVIGIINSAQASQRKSDAASIDTACNDFYAGVVSGVINESNKGKLTTTLPAADASASTRKDGALKLTAADAIKYSGLDTLLNKASDFGWKNGHIYSLDDDANKTGLTACSANFADTFTKMGFGTGAKTE